MECRCLSNVKKSNHAHYVRYWSLYFFLRSDLINLILFGELNRLSVGQLSDTIISKPPPGRLMTRRMDQNFLQKRLELLEAYIHAPRIGTGGVGDGVGAGSFVIPKKKR